MLSRGQESVQFWLETWSLMLGLFEYKGSSRGSITDQFEFKLIMLKRGSLSFQLLSLLNDFFIILILSSLTVKTWIRQPEKGKNDCTRVGWVFSAKSVTVLCMYGNSKKIRENGNLLLENYFKIQFSTSKIKRKKKKTSISFNFFMILTHSLVVSLWQY